MATFLSVLLTFLSVLLMVYTFRKLLGLLESAIFLQASTREINVELANFSSSAIGIIHIETHFINFIADTI